MLEERRGNGWVGGSGKKKGGGWKGWNERGNGKEEMNNKAMKFFEMQQEMLQQWCASRQQGM